MTAILNSGTYDFFLTNSDLLLESFDRCGIRPTQLTRQHMISAVRSLNLEMAHLSNFVPNLWVIEEGTPIPLLDGVATYELPNEVMTVLDVYVRTTQDGISNDIILLPISRTDYASIPTKNQEGKPTSYWLDRTATPTLTVWPVQNEDDLFTLRFYQMRRIQDSNAKMAQTPEVTVRYLEAVCAGVAARLAEKYAPEREDKLRMTAMMKLKEAQTEDRERVVTWISPTFDVYYTGF